MSYARETANCTHIIFQKSFPDAVNTYAAITLKIQSTDKFFVVLSADKHHFVGRLKLLH